MAQTKYIYGVIDSNEEKKFSPVEKGKTDEVYTLPYQDIACVVSDYPKKTFDYGTREQVAKKLVSHQAVIEKVMEEHTIIPIKFATLLANSDEVKNVLEKGYSGFKDKLKKLDKKIELDVAAVWNDLDSVIKKIGDEDEEIRKFKEEVAKKPPKETFQDRVKIGSMIKEALDKKKEELQREMLEFLKDKVKVDEAKKHELMDDSMVLNSAFLLDKDKEKEFDQALNELNKRYNERINFRCVGPLPLYSFASYEVKKVSFKEIDEARNMLELGEETTLNEIKESYRKLAQKYHPDNDPNNPDLEKKFEGITKAYKLLISFCGEGLHPKEKCSFREGSQRDVLIIDILRV